MSEVDELRHDLQTLRTKKKYIYEHSTQMGLEADGLSSTRAQLEIELAYISAELQNIKNGIQLKEKETEIIRGRVQQEIRDLKLENGTLEQNCECFPNEESNRGL